MTREVEVVGVDPGKNWFHVIGMDRVGRIVLRRRLNRTQLGELAATLPACRVAMESCPASQYWGRRFVAQGHEVRIIPAQFVKPFVKSNKSDYDDAEAIAEASTRDTTRCVPLKNAEQLDLQATHRVRQRFVIERTAAVNQMRALLLENGLAVPIGRALFARRLPDILADAENVLSIRVSALLQRLRARWLALDVEITEMTALLMQHAEGSELCRRAITVPGVGPIVSTALIATVGNAHAFRRGRDMAAWLGLVPWHSTGGLGRISKRGNAYLRQLFIQGAQALYTHMKRESSRMGQWLRDLEPRAHRHVIWCWNAFGYRFPNFDFDTFDLTMANTSNSHSRVCTEPVQVHLQRLLRVHSAALVDVEIDMITATGHRRAHPIVPVPVQSRHLGIALVRIPAIVNSKSTRW